MTKRNTLLLIVVCIVTACSTATPAPTPTLEPTPLPSATSSLEPRAVTITTSAGATLNGNLFGSGDTAVVFSLMGDCKNGWTELAKETAQHGFLALVYEWSACKDNGVDNGQIRRFVDDTRAAIAFVREQGATRVILAGASLGGVASAKLLVESKAIGLIVLAAPDAIPEWNFRIDSADVNSDVPKLFITTENDGVVLAARSRALHDLAAEPKEWQTYAGATHGSDVFDSDSGDAAQERVLQFIIAADARATQTIPAGTASIATPESFFSVYSDAPIVSNGADGAWDDRFTDPGALVYHDGAFHMFRNGFRDWPAAVQIGYVTSPDGYTWTRQGDDPVFKTDDVSYAGIAALASSAIVEEDGTWVLYFYTWQSRSYPSSGGIGRASAPAPEGPWTPDAELVLEPGASGAWDSAHMLAPNVLRTAEGYVMYYSGYDRSGIQQIGRATSVDGVHWTKYDDAATTESAFAQSDPVLQPGESGSWDASWVHQSSVFQTDDGWVMFYRGVADRQGQDMALGFAVSVDGIHWEKSARNPILTPQAVPRAQYFWFTNVLHHADTFFLFWEVDINQSTEIYLATHRGPPGE